MEATMDIVSIILGTLFIAIFFLYFPYAMIMESRKCRNMHLLPAFLLSLPIACIFIDLLDSTIHHYTIPPACEEFRIENKPAKIVVSLNFSDHLAIFFGKNRYLLVDIEGEKIALTRAELEEKIYKQEQADEKRKDEARRIQERKKFLEEHSSKRCP